MLVVVNIGVVAVVVLVVVVGLAAAVAWPALYWFCLDFVQGAVVLDLFV